MATDHNFKVKKGLHVLGSEGIYLTDTNTRLHEGSGNALRITTSSGGYVDLGSMNSGWVHMQMNKNLYILPSSFVAIDGNLQPYADSARTLGADDKRWSHIYGDALTIGGAISSGAITSSGASSGRYTGLEVVNTTNAAGTETAIGLGVVSVGNSSCDVKLVANRVGANSGSDFYIEQTDSSGNQDETFRITEDGNATFAGTITANGKITSTELTITGGTDSEDIYINNTSPTLGFTDSNSFSDSNDVYLIRGASTGKLQFQFKDDSAGTTTETFLIDQSGNTDIAGTISSGAITSTGTSTFANVTITGDLSITGDINSYNVTDLDVSDKTITLGVGQTEANSGDSGIKISGSNASLLWDEANDYWETNKGLFVNGEVGTHASFIVNKNNSSGDGVVARFENDGVDESTIRFRNSGTGHLDVGIGSGNQFILKVPHDNTVGSSYDLTFDGTKLSVPQVGVTNIVTNKVVKFNGTILDDSIITDNGTSIGISQGSPSSTYKLDVSGAIRSNHSAPGLTLRETDASNQEWIVGSYGGTFAIRDVTGGTYPVYVEAGTSTSTLYVDSNDRIGIRTNSPDATLHVQAENVGVKTTYAQMILEHTDAQLDITSSSAGTWGSAINFVEGASTSANTNVWSIARNTGTSPALNFNFGAGNQHDNANKVKFASGGTVSIDTGTTSGTFLSLTRNGGTEIGRIAYSATDNISIYGTNNHAGINFISAALIPMQGASELDNTIALGDGTRNFSEIFVKGMTVGTTQVIDASRNIKNVVDYHSDGRLQAASVHGQNTHVGAEVLFEITDFDDSTSVKRKFGYNDSNSNFSKSTDSTAPASGVFDVYEYASPQWGPKIPIDDYTEIIFECWMKHVSGDDTSGNFYVGGSFYDGSDTYLGNSNRYWGANGDAQDANNTGWRHIKGILRGDAIRAQSATSTAQFVQLLTLFNYNTGSNWGTNAQTTRFCGFRFYRSKKTVSSLWLKTSNGTTNYQDSNPQTLESYTAALVVGQDHRIYGNGTGTNTTPQFSFNGDTDTGLGYITTDTVGLIAGGSRKFYVNGTNAYFQNLTGGVSVPALTATSLDVNGNADISGSLNMSGGHLYLNNFNIYEVNALEFNDPGPNEGISWSGGSIKIYESPDDLTTNTAGNLQVVYGSTRRLTVNSTGVDVNGVLEAGASDNISMSSGSNGQLKIMGNGYTGAIALDGTAMHVYHNSSSRSLILGTNETARVTIGGSGGVSFNNNDLTSCGNITADQGTFKSDSEALRVSSVTNGVGATILFSDNGSPPALTSGQRGYIEYYHGDTASYGSGNAFVLTGTEATMTVLADGKLMFKEGLYLKPGSGTGAGTVVIDSSRNLHGNGVYVGSWNASTSSTVGRIGKVSDRVAGSITNQIGGSTSAKWEVVDYGWTKVLFQVNNAGLASSNGGISITGGNLQMHSTGRIYFGGGTTYGIGAGGHNYNSGYFDTLESGTSTDPLEMVYYQGPGVNVGSGASKYLACASLGVGTGAGGSATPVRSGYLVHLKSTGDAAMLIEGDSDNVTETDQAWIRFEQDGGAIGFTIGTHDDNNIRLMNEYASAIDLGVGNTIRARLANDGNFTVTGNVTAYGSISDIRRKENIEVIPNAVDKVKTLDGITFNFKDKPEERMTGVIAQQVMEVLPEAVYETETIEKEETYAVHYGNMVGLLIEAMKEQQQQIESLKEEINILKGEK